MEYLEVYIKQDDNEDIGQKVYQERLTILKEFLCYLEEKNIINPDTIHNVDEIKKLVSGLMKIDLSKICAPPEEQPREVSPMNYVTSKRSEYKTEQTRLKKQRMNSAGNLKYPTSSKYLDLVDKENCQLNENSVEAKSKPNFDYNSVIKKNLVVKL